MAAGDEDEKWMALALEEARAAEDRDEVPAGAVVVSAAGELIGRAGNSVRGLCDPSAHAEVLALRRAGAATGNYRLTGASVYTTLEPCPMCMAAAIHARAARVVYGAAEPKWGAHQSMLNLADMPGWNHRVEVIGGVMADEAAGLMKRFFERRRGTEVAVTGATRNRLVR